MKKSLSECADLRDFLTSNYELDDLKIFALTEEAFLGDYNCSFYCREVFEVFEEEINERYKSLGFGFGKDSFFSEKAQKLMWIIQDLSEKIIYEHNNPDCGEKSPCS